MTGRTHDLAAFTALSAVLVLSPIPTMTLGTALIAFGANMIGGLAPDIDQPSASMWNKLRGGNIIARLVKPLFGGHRFISHSIIGVLIFGFVAKQILLLSSSFLIIDVDIVWWSFMIGFVSHLVMDLFTREGIPLFFPIPVNFGIPPLSVIRMKTGGLVEKSFVFPMLLLINFYIYYTYYPVFLDFIKNYIN